MNKKIVLTIIMCIIACVVLTGCQSNEVVEKEQENSNVVTETKNDTNKEENTSSNTAKNTASNKSNDKSNSNDKLKPTEVVKKYKEDIGLGLEVYHPKVNGREVVVNVQTSGSSEQQKKGPYYIWYEMRIGYDSSSMQDTYKLVKEGIYHLEGYGIEMLKEFKIDEDEGVNYEFFEWDLTATACKGSDKEYVAVSFPAGTEDKAQATLLLSTAEGDLVGEFTADVVHDVTLTGTNAEKYKNHSGDVVFNSIKDGKVTYLVPSDKMYKKDSKGNKVLDTSLDTLELDEYSVTINNNKATSKKTDETYKITNAKGKTFGFGEFRH
ncbi:MAG: hypothetical protein IKP28_06175 [Clostridia bacterium]|nr:hypothetical protein [Clostridia bacterium]